MKLLLIWTYIAKAEIKKTEYQKENEITIKVLLVTLSEY